MLWARRAAPVELPGGWGWFGGLTLRSPPAPWAGNTLPLAKSPGAEPWGRRAAAEGLCCG